MSEIRITFVDAGDWIGLYVDGDLKAQGHDIPEHEVARILVNSIPIDNAVVEERWDWDPDGNGGQLPQNIGDVSWE